ncbi:MAG: phosphocholine cytidylyltransferase family protein [Candidatus Odinarchaeia archaeon]
MKAVILAAGRGSRLYPLTEKYPKPLIPISGIPLIQRIILNIRDLGINEFVVVIGYKGNKIKGVLGDGSSLGVKIEYCRNPDYKLGNGYSLYVTKNLISKDDDPFILVMSDHIIDIDILKMALVNVDNHPLLCVDFMPKFSSQLKDATKVLVDELGYITDIGKNITNWNGVDTGVFILNMDVFDIIEDLKSYKQKITITDCVKKFAKLSRPLWACDVSERIWFDIDTLEDLNHVEKFLTGET